MAAVLAGTGPVGAGVRALCVFLLLYVVPSALSTSRTAAGVKVVGAVLAFLLLTVSFYRYLRSRAEDREDAYAYTAPDGPALPAAASAAEETAPAKRLSVAGRPVEQVGQAALERACIALYQFNGLNSQTVAVGSAGSYRIRLTPRGATQAVALLQCVAGAEPQGVEHYQALLVAMEEEGVAKAFFVAPAGFSQEVAAQARARHVTLVDAKLLKAMIDRLPEGAQTAVSALLH